MRSSSLQVFVVGSLLVFAGTAMGLESPKATVAKPGAGVSRQLASPGEGKRTASPPGKGTIATGDEDETDDLEIQRRTIEGASKEGGLSKVPKTPSQLKGNNTMPVKGPKTPPPPKDNNAIPVKIPR